MSRGPLPSTLCLLSSIPEQRRGQKIRFLGCVTSYSTETATLTLGHLYPEGTDITVKVDAQLVLHRLASDMVQVGQWLNVIGTVEKHYRSAPGRPRSLVQALLIWSTGGPFDLAEYEASLSKGNE